jgi:hypothetical protein
MGAMCNYFASSAITWTLQGVTANQMPLDAISNRVDDETTMLATDRSSEETDRGWAVPRS